MIDIRTAFRFSFYSDEKKEKILKIEQKLGLWNIEEAFGKVPEGEMKEHLRAAILQGRVAAEMIAEKDFDW